MNKRKYTRIFLDPSFFLFPLSNSSVLQYFNLQKKNEELYT